MLDDVDTSAVLLGPDNSHERAYGIHTYHEGRISFGVRTDQMARVDYTDYNFGTWYHIAGFYDAATIEVYYT